MNRERLALLPDHAFDVRSGKDWTVTPGAINVPGTQARLTVIFTVVAATWIARDVINVL